jgi:excisionase family DNA binding protein
MTTSHSDKLLRVGELSDWLGVSRSTIYKWVKEEMFPAPIILGHDDGTRSASRWKTAEVEEWLNDRPRGVQHELQ